LRASLSFGPGAADHRRQESPRAGEIEYRFTAGGAIRTLLVNEDLRRLLSSGALVIAQLDERLRVVARVAGEKVRERDAA
jgi:uncharacterized protein YaiL (DUF2058 family)